MNNFKPRNNMKRSGGGFRKSRKGGYSHSRSNSHSNSYSHSSSDTTDGYVDFRNLKKYQAAREKYIGLAKDALSYGDRVMSENYLQHADHYLRIVNNIEERSSQYRNEYNNHTGNGADRIEQVANIAVEGNVAAAPVQDNQQPIVELEKEVING